MIDNYTTWLFLACVFAGLTGIAVWGGNKHLEYVAKPAVIICAIVAACVSDRVAPEIKWFLVSALGFSLIGDVFLMFSKKLFFMLGLGVFLFAHIAYIVGFWKIGSGYTWGTSPQQLHYKFVHVLGFKKLEIHYAWMLVGTLVVIGFAVFVLPKIVRALGHEKNRSERIPVLLYMAVVSAMLITAWGTHYRYLIFGATLFYISDIFIGWNRYVNEKGVSPTAILAMYQLGQLAILFALVR